jgi:hypothetical protein
VPIGASVCPQCGAVKPEPEAKPMPESEPGELEEVVSPAKIRELERSAKTLSDWHQVAKLRNFKGGWAWHQFQKKRKIA